MDADALHIVESDDVPAGPPSSPDTTEDDGDDIPAFAVYPPEMVNFMFGKTTEYTSDADEFIFGGNETLADILLQIVPAATIPGTAGSLPPITE